MKISDDRKVEVFKNLVTQDLYRTGVAFNFDKYYSTKGSVIAAVHRIVTEVKNNPERFGLTMNSVELVTKALNERNNQIHGRTVAEQEAAKELAKKDIKEIVISGRDRLAKLLHKKIDMLDNSRNALRNESLPKLATTFAILFDKAQIIKGEATEHVAILSRIADDMKPEEAIDRVLKMREALHEQEDETK